MISWTKVHDHERICLVALAWRIPFDFIVVLDPDHPSQGLRQRLDGEEPRTTSSPRTLARGTVARLARRFKFHFHDRVLYGRYVSFYSSSIR